MTKIDIIDEQHLLKLAAQNSVAGRTELAGTISGLFDESAGSLSDRERILMFDILRSIIHDVEMSVRRNLSETLANLPDASHELILTLANDEIEIAYPVLAKSVVLRDRDLIEVIRKRTFEHQLSIAARESVSEDVSQALVSAGDEGVIKELLANPNSRISRSTMEYLAEESRRVDTFQEPVLRHTDLDQDLAQRMFTWVTSSLRDHILSRYDFDATTIDVLLQDAATAEMEIIQSAGARQSKSSLLALELEEEGMLNTDLMIRALREGQASIFISMFSRLLGVSIDLVTEMLFEPRGEGLAIACKASGIGKASFTAIFAISRKTRPGGGNKLRRQTGRALSFFDMVSEDAAGKVLTLWKNGGGYLPAIRNLELGSSKK